METIAALSLAVVSIRFFASLIVGCALVIDASRQGRDFEIRIGVVQGLRFKSKSQQPEQTSVEPRSDADLVFKQKGSGRRLK